MSKSTKNSGSDSHKQNKKQPQSNQVWLRAIWLDFRIFIRENAWIPVFFCVVFVALYKLTHMFNPLLFLIPLLILLVVALFTREIVAHDDTDTMARQARGVIILGYLFLCAALWFAFWLLLSKIENPAPIEYSIIPKNHPTPSLLVTGCEYIEPIDKTNIDDGDAGQTILVPENLPSGLKYCGNRVPQRLIVIGGIQTTCGLNGTCPVKLVGQPEELNPNPFTSLVETLKTCEHDIEKIVNLKSTSPNPCANKNALDTIKRKIKEKAQDAEAYEISRLKNPGSTETTIAIQQIESDIKRLKDLEDIVSRRLYQLDNLKTATSLPAYLTGQLIVGGIVVPVYFVFCALLGAIISMARKLPEFQARLANKNDTKIEFRGEEFDSLKLQEIPELVLFQVVQVCSAPILGIIAYGYLSDDLLSDFTAISVGFAAGFSSEWVLVMVRSITDRLSGATPRRLSKYRPKEAKQKSEIKLANGLAEVGDKVQLIQAVEQYSAGQSFVIIKIEGQKVTATETSGAGTVARSPAFFILSQPNVEADFVELGPRQSSNFDG